MRSVVVTVDPAFALAPVQPRTFGSFVEHLGRCVYGGIYEPGHPAADAAGFRRDVIELVKELGVTTVRYPGGNFVSSYRWEDGVGPVESRPRRLEPAWHSIEPNTVGLDEFMAWTKQVGVEPMLAANLGTRGLQEACDLLEYCNVRGGTALSDQRRANGAAEPHRVRMWCLGNEMDGPWQVGQKTGREYGRLASQTAKAMRRIDPDLELVVCGSSSSAMPSFGEWERDVLIEAYDDVDFVSAHAYYQEKDGDLGSFLASALDMDYFIDSVVATCDHVRAVKKSPKRIDISFDEWNVWYMGGEASTPPSGDDWPVGPRLLEDNYNVADAVVVGSLLICLLRHSDRVRAASLAQLVNVIAPIMTEPGGPAWRQTIFHPFALTARHARGEVLRTPVDSPQYETAEFGPAPLVDAVATHDRQSGQTAIFAVNRSTAEPVRLEAEVRSLPGARIGRAVVLSNPDHAWRASAANSDSVSPRPLAATLDDAVVRAALPPLSWSMIRLTG